MAPEADGVAAILHAIALNAEVEGVVALLHVSALTSVLFLAFLKIDKVYDGTHDALDQNLEEIRKIASKIVLENGLNDISVNLRDFWRLNIIFPTCIICLISGNPRVLGRVLTLVHFCYRQLHIPLFIYFKKHRHIGAGWLMATISVATFFGCAFALIWKVHIDAHWVKWAFVSQLLVMLLLLATNLISMRMTPVRLKQKCESLMIAVKARMEKQTNSMLKAMLQFEAIRRKERLATQTIVPVPALPSDTAPRKSRVSAARARPRRTRGSSRSKKRVN